MAGQLSKYEREVRDTVLKSSFTGVAATVIAVTAISPAGFGDWIGASLASNIGFDATDAADNPYVSLPPFAPPLTEAELDSIRSQLSSAEASLTLLRAATDANIERARALAATDGAVTFAPTPPVARSAPELRLALSQPAGMHATASFSEAPVESYVAVAPPESVTPTPVNYSGGGGGAGEYRDPHLELADLFFAHETF